MKQKIYKITCVICGKIFEQTGLTRNWSKRKTCSLECEKFYRAKRIKERRSLSPETYARIVKTRSNNPKMKPNEDFYGAISYHLLSPDGKEFHGVNLSLFVREHFPDDNFKSVHRNLAKLSPSEKYRRHSWHGWTWIGNEVDKPNLKKQGDNHGKLF